MSLSKGRRGSSLRQQPHSLRSPPGDSSSRRSRTNVRSSCSSRTCTGRTRRFWTSSTTSSTGRAESSYSSCARRAPSSSSGDGLLRGVGLEDAGLCFHDLPESPEGDAVAVREAAHLSPRDELRIAIGRLGQLEDEPRLPIPGTPMRVTSWDDRSWRARVSALSRSRSS